MSTKSYSLILDPAAFLTVQTADGAYEARIDIFLAWEMLGKSEEQPNEVTRWKMVEKYLIEALKAPEDYEIARNILVEFHNAVVGIGRKVKDDAKKKLEETVS